MSNPKLFQHATVIGWSEERQVLEITEDGSLLIEGDRISGIWPTGQEPPIPQKGLEIINAMGKILTPGFIDTHRHNWQVIFRTMKNECTIWDYFTHVMAHETLHTMTAEDVYNAQLLGMYEGLNTGVTTQLDHAHHPPGKERAEAALRASIESGARIYHAHTIGNNWIPVDTKQMIAEFRELEEQYRDALKSSPVSLSLSCDDFGLKSREDVDPIVSFLHEHEVPVLTTHSIAGPYGVDNGPKVLHNLGILDVPFPVVISHASFLDQASYQLLKRFNQYTSITIESEMSFGQTNPTAHHCLDQSSLGLDSIWCNSGDMLTQARILLQYVRFQSHTEVVSRWCVPANMSMTPDQAFLFATRQGGLALRRSDLGILAPGAKADVLVWDTTNLAMTGYADPVAAVLLHANVGDIESVLVDGVFRKRDGKLLVPDLKGAQERFAQSAGKVQAKALGVKRREVRAGDRFFSGAEIEVVPRVNVKGARW